jgi:type IV fimbrial biogenesis protein FimT
MSPSQRRPAATGAKRRGLTLIELMVTLAILAVLMAIAVPSMQQLIARKRVAGVAGELASDIRYPRSLGVQTANPVQIDFGADSTSTWYNLSVDANERGPCTVPADCNGLLKKPVSMKFVSLKTTDGISVASGTANIRFTGTNAMSINGAIVRATISSSLGGSVKVQTNAAGRPSACSISGQESNFPACI